MCTTRACHISNISLFGPIVYSIGLYHLISYKRLTFWIHFIELQKRLTSILLDLASFLYKNIYHSRTGFSTYKSSYVIHLIQDLHCCATVSHLHKMHPKLDHQSNTQHPETRIISVYKPWVETPLTWCKKSHKVTLMYYIIQYGPGPGSRFNLGQNLFTGASLGTPQVDRWTQFLRTALGLLSQI